MCGAPHNTHARRQFFELADIAANARRGKQAPASVCEPVRTKARHFWPI